MVKKNELKSLNHESLKSRLEDLRKDLMKVNSKRSSKSSIENPGRIKHIKRNIARLLTYMKNKGGKQKNNG
ncbi:50S ribosomal protein L29 [Candidatus Woesearchaeota archaeon]|nr:50S ribosomal protein L29 [Candidatus Woesearchaeota archaeon]